MAVSSLVGLFNVFVGLMLVAAFLLMGAGLIMWYIRLGAWPSYRDEAIKIMEWAVAVLFVLVMLLGAAQVVQKHTGSVLFGLGVLVVLVVAYVAVTTFSSGEEKKSH